MTLNDNSGKNGANSIISIIIGNAIRKLEIN